ncbi:MAG TPA: SDR family NAD(P)-dependent oxidoreductase, partial [Luteitalea sp.]|nr:SDR family NAD(P)-dependent oxidoreductase [Luteitalea sp.]
VIDLDVTDDVSVRDGVQAAVALAGALDVVVNNAGIVGLGLTEGFTPEQFAHMFDVNVGGAVRVNRAVLPAMRARGRGLLIHLSSAAGRATVPGLAPYCASKYALEALADAYRYELQPWGVQSVLVEPGIYRTAIFDQAMRPDDTARVDGYGPHGNYVDTVGHVFASAMADPKNPGSAEVAEAVVGLVEMEPVARPFRTVVSAPLVPLLTPYNDMADRLRPVIASIFWVPHLIDAPPAEQG